MSHDDLYATIQNLSHHRYGHYTGQPALADTFSYELEDFAGAKFYSTHANADSSQCIQIS